jgi:hypothetical protein
MKTFAAFCLLIISFFAGPATAINWPNNAQSAVSISADDGWPTQLTQASILEWKIYWSPEYPSGFRGTFYLSAVGMPSVVTNKAAWKGVFQRGHEVGNHSYEHWCDLTQKVWSQVASDTGNMEWWLLSEIYSMVSTDHTYAYPCGNYIIGPQSTLQQRQVGACEYAALLSAAVTGARVVDGAANDPANVARRRFYITGASIKGATPVADAIAAIDNGIANGTWTVLVFHSLGESGDGNSISQMAYQQIVDYVHQRRAQLWVAPVVTVKNYIIANTPASDWNCKLP